MRRKTSNRTQARQRVRVVECWRDLGYAAYTIEGYLQWVEKHRAWCRARDLEELGRLTRACVDRFARSYARARKIDVRVAVMTARPAMHTWAKTLAKLGWKVPAWTPLKVRPFDAMLAQYREFRRRWRGVQDSSLRMECRALIRFLRWLTRHRLRLASITTVHIDRYVVELSSKLVAKTVAGICSALRSFLRFLHVTGATAKDMSADVPMPRLSRGARLPTVLPWREIRRILRNIDRRTALGKRDYAALLMMAAYGMGAGEALSLQLDDIDWTCGSLRVRRPKTGVEVVLPLLGPVGLALASYLRRGRPPAATARAVFVRARAPHPRLCVRALGRRFRFYARSAGVSARPLGTHVIRRCHATREVEMAAPTKIVSDILGHADPKSLSAYARVATERLRDVSLPLPR